MGWTAPRTWTVGEMVTAALLNQQIRDNLLLTAPALAAAAGDTFYADADHSLARLALGSANRFYRVNGGATAPQWDALSDDDLYPWLISIDPAAGANSSPGTGTILNPAGSNPVYGVRAVLSGNGTGAYWYVPIVGGGTYSLLVLYHKHPDAPKFDASLDATSIVAGVDSYAAAAASNFATVTSFTAPAGTGRKALTLTINGKNASSGGYDLRFGRVCLARTA